MDGWNVHIETKKVVHLWRMYILGLNGEIDLMFNWENITWWIWSFISDEKISTCNLKVLENIGKTVGNIVHVFYLSY